MRTLVMLGAALALCACDDEEGFPLEGRYEVTAHTLAAGCGAAQPVSEDCRDCRLQDTHFKLKEQSFLGQSFVSYVPCEADGSCDDDDDEPGEVSINLGAPLFDHQEGDAWIGEASASSGFEGRCTYSRTEYRLEETEAGVRVTVSKWRLREGYQLPESLACEEGDDSFDCGCLALAENPPPDEDQECEQVEAVEAVEAQADE